MEGKNKEEAYLPVYMLFSGIFFENYIYVH